MLNIIITAYDPLPFGQIMWIVSLVLIFSVVLSFIFRGKEKTDKGFVFLYNKLSYRRRFIRDIWMSPVAFLFLIVAFRIANIHPATEMTVYVIAIIIILVPLTYNFIMWKKHEENR